MTVQEASLAPADEAELAETVRGAAGPLCIIGGGTRPVGRPVEGAVLSVAELRGITLYEPGALTLVVRAGTPLTEVEATLAAEGQRLAFEPMDHRVLLGTTGEPTIGGVAAANVSGPRRIQAGACRDAMLGVRFIDGMGNVVKNGGRVMKNVTGLDLVKLTTGSRGTLGVLSEVALRVQAAPEAEATLTRRGLDPTAGVAALSAALGSPFEVSGAAWLEAGLAGAQSETRLRIEGMEGSVSYRAGRLRDLLGGDWEVAEGAASAALWAEVRDVRPFAARPGAVWRVSVRPTDGPRMLATLHEGGTGCEAMLDWGGGLLWLLVPDAGDAGAAALRRLTTHLGGHATLVRATERLRREVPVFEPENPSIAALSRGLRAKFDPRGILNPGLMG